MHFRYRFWNNTFFGRISCRNSILSFLCTTAAKSPYVTLGSSPPFREANFAIYIINSSYILKNYISWQNGAILWLYQTIAFARLLQITLEILPLLLLWEIKILGSQSLRRESSSLLFLPEFVEDNYFLLLPEKPKYTICTNFIIIFYNIHI